MNKELLKHHIIGVDLDGTLINHPRSHVLQSFIYHNTDRKFHLITFRSHNMKLDIEKDMYMGSALNGIPLTTKCFSSINTASDEMMEAYSNGTEESYKRFLEWKPQICQQLECTILIDDIRDIAPFCDQYNINYFHPDDLGGRKRSGW